MADLDPRLLRYFLAVADHRSFTDAANALHISQPALSQAIRRLEHVVGTQLIDRGIGGSRSGVVLTAAGAVFAPAATAVLEAGDQAVRAVRALAQQVRVVVGFGTSTPRSLTRRVLEAFGHGEAPQVVLQHVPWGEERTMLAEGSLDLVFLQAPPGLADPALRTVALATTRRMAVFSVDHPLAGYAEVSMKDLADEPIIDAASDRAYWIVDPRPDSGRPRTVGTPARTVDEMLSLVSAGRGMAITSSTVAATNRSDELAFVPIKDLAPATVYLGRRASDTRRVVAAVLERMAPSDSSAGS